MSYDQPDKGSGFSPSEHPEWANQLMLIWPISVENIVFTRNDGTPDPTDMVTADVAIISLPDPKTGQPVFLKNARIGGKALTPQIKNKVGKKVLGKFTQLPKQPGKNAAFALDVPASDTPEWQQMVMMATQYEQNYPRTDDSYTAPTNGTPSWQQQSAPPAGAATPAWGTTATGANGGSQQPLPGPQAPPPATPAQQSWGGATGQPAAAPTPWPDGLREFLQGRGYDTAQMDEATARQIAATL